MKAGGVLGAALQLRHVTADLAASAASLLPACLVVAHVPAPFWLVSSAPASRHYVCLHRRGRWFLELPATLQSRRVEGADGRSHPHFLTDVSSLLLNSAAAFWRCQSWFEGGRRGFRDRWPVTGALRLHEPFSVFVVLEETGSWVSPALARSFSSSPSPEVSPLDPEPLLGRPSAIPWSSTGRCPGTQKQG